MDFPDLYLTNSAHRFVSTHRAPNKDEEKYS